MTKYTFHAPPFVFTMPKPQGFVYSPPGATDKTYIGGICEGWLDYTPELWAEVQKQWQEWQQQKQQVKLLVDQEPEEFKVKSNSDPNKSYTVKKHPDGSWTCDCPGYGFRRKCSHIEKMKGKS